MHKLLNSDFPKSVVVEIDPTESRLDVFSGKPDRKSVLAFGVNYGRLGKPVGAIIADGKIIKGSGLFSPPRASLRTIGNDSPQLSILRATVRFGRLISEDGQYSLVATSLLQAGPIIIQQGVYSAARSCVREAFADSVLAENRHLAIGITHRQSLLVAYDAATCVSDLAARLLALDCHTAMLAAPGHSVFLKYLTHQFGEFCCAGFQIFRAKGT